MLSSHTDDARCHSRPEIAIEGDRELGLRRVALDNARNWSEAGKSGVDQVVAEAALVRFSDDSLQPFLEGRRGWLRFDRTLSRRQHRCREKQCSQPGHAGKI